jgi:glycosyltransferase involved in cell wall biosynthesis
MRYLVDHGRTGLLSEPGNPEALAENVLRVLREPEFGLRLAANAFEELRPYRWESVREQWLHAYRALVPEKAGMVEESIAGT